MLKEKKTFLVLIIIIIGLPIIFFNNQKDYYSYIDNRNLVEIREFNSLNELFNNINEYVNERIGLRKEMVFVYQNLNMNILHHSSHIDYELGKDGELFPSFMDNQEYDEYKKCFTEAVIKMNEYCKSRDVGFYLMFDPNKQSIYSEYLPLGVNYNNDWAKEMLHILKDNNIKVSDNLEYFEEIKEETRIYNHKDDVTHYNDMGAFLACNNLLNIISEDYPSVEANKLEDFNAYHIKQKYIDNTNILINEEIEIIESSKKHEIDEDYLYQRQVLQIDHTFSNFEHYKNENDKPRILAFEGSYLFGRNHHDYLVSQASDYIAIHNYQNILNLPYYINVFKPDIIIFDVAEFVIADYFFSYDKLKDLDFQKSLNKIDYNYEYKEIGAINDYIFNEVFEVVEINTSNNNLDAYLIIGDETFELERNEDGYILVTLKKNIIDNNYRLILNDDKNHKCYIQDGCLKSIK